LAVVPGIEILIAERLKLCRGRRVGVLCHPASVAPELTHVVDRLVRSGVKAILNFAPVPLNVPSDVEVKTVNMALELETLSYSLANR